MRWYGRRHQVLVQKYQRQALVESMRQATGGILRPVREQEGLNRWWGALQVSAENTVGFLKWKSAIRIHREYLSSELNFTGVPLRDTGLLSQQRWIGRAGDPRMHPQAGKKEKRQEQLALGGSASSSPEKVQQPLSLPERLF